jgi:hypothetical protein
MHTIRGLRVLLQAQIERDIALRVGVDCAQRIVVTLFGALRIVKPVIGQAAERRERGRQRQRRFDSPMLRRRTE